MPFSAKDLAHLKKLCRIDCSPEEEASFFQDISRILSYVEEIQKIDTKGVAPCRFVLRSMVKNQVRADQVGNLLSREVFLANAPDQIGGMIRVPPVLSD